MPEKLALVQKDITGMVHAPGWQIFKNITGFFLQLRLTAVLIFSGRGIYIIQW
jgi:hypothetical protein